MKRTRTPIRRFVQPFLEDEDEEIVVVLVADMNKDLSSIENLALKMMSKEKNFWKNQQKCVDIYIKNVLVQKCAFTAFKQYTCKSTDSCMHLHG